MTSIGKVSFDIIVPHYGARSEIENFMRSLHASGINKKLQAIIVVENGQQANAKNIAATFPDLPIKYCHVEEPGLTNARNEGVKHAQSDFLIFLDNDLSFSKGFLDAYAEAFVKCGKAYFYGGPIEPKFESEPKKWLLPYAPSSVKGFDLCSDQIISKPLFLGGNHAISRHAVTHLIRKFGSLNEGESATGTEGGVGEETRLQQKLLQQNFSGFFVAGARVFHPVPNECLSYKWICRRRYRAGVSAAHENRLISPPGVPPKVPLWLRKLYIEGYLAEFFLRLFSDQHAIKSGLKRAWAQGAIEEIQKPRPPSNHG